jgi:hypothetical protein
VPVAVHDVPESGRSFDLAADATARTLLAETLGLRSLPRLSANFEVTRHGRNGLRVVGQVAATVGQTCVVTLDPIESEITEAVDLTFAPPAAAPEEGRTRLAAEDGPEPLVGGHVDLGMIATEFLTLGIDPYPRKSDAVFEAPAAGDTADHPFAALAALKRDRQDSG